MTTELITQGVWRRLTAAAKKTHRPSLVAVAYFGKNAGGLLPLRRGSRLVVDASEAAVSSGQTCPTDLKKYKGVRIFSVQNLHAKLFVLGSRAYIGSANASHHSAGTMLEAVIETTDRNTVKAARNYVRGLCLHELGQEELDRLAKLYKPPRIKGRRKKQRKKRVSTLTRPDLPTLRIAQLVEGYPPAGSENAQEAGEKVARAKRKKRQTHVLEDFFWPGNCPYQKGDTVVQVVKQENEQKLVSPPANVIHTKIWRRGQKRVTFVYLEVPERRRKRLERLAKQLGYGAKKRLGRGGKVGDQAFAEKLRSAWDL